MQHGLKWVVPILALGLLLGARPAAAQTVIGNLPQANDAAGSDLTNGIRKAISFTMGSSPYSLAAVRLRLHFDAADTPGVVQLLNDSGGIDPGTTSLVTFQNPAFATGTATYTFTPSSPFYLQANTKYWLQVTGANSSNAWTWTGSDPDLTPTGPGATFGTLRHSTNGGASWNLNTTINSFEIQGQNQAVPEPGAVMLFLPALAAVAAIRRRKS